MSKNRQQPNHKVERARELRRLQTPAEARLWQLLRNRRLGGHKFRRQHPVDRFVVDFCCPALHLVVEVDGSVHRYTEESDALRTAHLEALGYHVLRLTNDQVEQDIGAVAQFVLARCAELEQQSRSAMDPDEK